MMDLQGRNFLKLLDFTPEEIEGLLDLAADLKKKKKLVSKNYIVEQTTNGLRCDKLTEPVPHKQNRPTQPLLNDPVTVSTLGKASASSTY